jgi:hypothetical protein
MLHVLKRDPDQALHRLVGIPRLLRPAQPLRAAPPPITRDRRSARTVLEMRDHAVHAP